MNGPTTEMKLAAAQAALKTLTGIMKVDRAEDGPDSGKLILYYVDKEGFDRLLAAEEHDSMRHFLETLGEALDNARMVTGELHFP